MSTFGSWTRSSEGDFKMVEKQQAELEGDIAKVKSIDKIQSQALEASALVTTMFTEHELEQMPVGSTTGPSGQGGEELIDAEKSPGILLSFPRALPNRPESHPIKNK